MNNNNFIILAHILMALTTFVALLLSLSPVLVSSQGGGGATVRCEPLAVSAWASTTITIDLYVENVASLFGADERLSFDPTGLQVEDANNYPDDGAQIEPLDELLQPDYVIKQEADNDAGAIWYAATQISPTMEVTGSGAVARITFNAIRAGTYTLPVTYAKLSDRHGTEITSSTRDCQVTFWGPISLRINRVNGHNELSWSYLGADIDHFEVWRSTAAPYLVPEDPGTVHLQPDAAGVTYTDVAAPASVNQYYVTRAFKTNAAIISAPSNRVGAFHFSLVPGSG